MLRAIDGDGESILGWEAQRGEQYRCPGCHEVVVFKPGRTVTPHFAHQAESRCAYAVGESVRHMEMKATIGRLVNCQVAYEVSLTPEHRADVVLPSLRIVVECQASKITASEWLRRTRDYNRAGYSVLWLWDGARMRRWDDGEFRVPDEIRLCHKHLFGRVYVLDDTNSIKAIHLERFERWNDGYDENGEYHVSIRTPKTLRRFNWRSVETPLRLGRLRSPDGHMLATLGDGVWWKPSNHL